MPELPEVEVTRRLLEPRLLSRTIVAVHTTAQSYFFLTRPAELKRTLLGRTIVGLERRGKYLLLELDGGFRLLLHLGMTGQLFLADSRSPRLLSQRRHKAAQAGGGAAFTPDQHTHLRLEFVDELPGLVFRDVRKFGKVRLLKPGQSDARLERLGTDALAIDAATLFERTRRRKAPIKSVLLDQSVLAGVGNIYADEALFMTGVRPKRQAARVSAEECGGLVDNLRRVLLRSIETGGSSISDFVAPDGSDGQFQTERKVYARTGEGCSHCGQPIKRIVIGARSSHYCPSCQR
jgi:formamidopyrimidine-DNA glycosylase